jgi:hypothetical protein
MMIIERQMIMTTNKEFAARRRLARLPQVAVAKCVGKSQAWLSLVEHGWIVPRAEDAAKLRAVLGISDRDSNDC